MQNYSHPMLCFKWLLSEAALPTINSQSDLTIKTLCPLHTSCRRQCPQEIVHAKFGRHIMDP